MGGAPDVRVGGVRLLGASRGRGSCARRSHSLISVRPPSSVTKSCVEPRLVDAQPRVGQQAVAVEPLDVVALVGRAVAPDVDAVVVHRAHQQGAGDGAAERRGVEVGLAGGADVERAAGQGDEALLDQGRACSRRCGRSRRRTRAPGPEPRRCRARRTGRGRPCRCRAPRPSRASRPPRRRCPGHRRTRYRPARRREVASEPWACRRSYWRSPWRRGPISPVPPHRPRLPSLSRYGQERANDGTTIESGRGGATRPARLPDGHAPRCTRSDGCSVGAFRTRRGRPG